MSNLIVYLITGANRADGFGFHTIKTLLEDPRARVVAAARDPSSAVELQELARSSEGRVHVLEVDVGELESVKSSFKEVATLPFVQDHGIDVLFANAGVMLNGQVPASKIDPADALKSFQVNTLGAIHVAQVFLPLLRLGTQKKIIYTSSALGSTTFATGPGAPGGFASYGLSKAASNHFFRRLSEELKDEGFTVLSYCPGLVESSQTFYKTGDKLGGGVAISPQEGGRISAELINSWGSTDTGKFFSREGTEIPW